MAEKTTRQQVEELTAKKKSAKEIAEILGKTTATIYSHLRNIEADGGEVRKSSRGRPRADAETPQAETPKPRPNPRAKATEPAKSSADKPNVFASSNGHSTDDDVITILTARKAEHEAAIQKIDTAIAALAA
jgi:biotin operon repressor